MFPTEKEHTLDLPKELYGLKIEVIAFPIEEEQSPLPDSKIDPDSFYDNIKLDFSNFKFNRDEANER